MNAVALRGTRHSPASFPRPLVLRPLCGTHVCAGFPSPAADHQEEPIDLNQELIRNEVATFYYKVIGNSGQDNFVRNGDIAVVDRSIVPVDGDVVLASLNRENCIKRFRTTKGQGHRRGRMWLESANPDYPDIEITGEATLIIEGVITYTIHAHRPKR